MRDTTLQQQKEERIKAAFAKHAKENKYSRQYIYQLLAAEFFLKASTIERIIWGEYDTNRNRRAARRMTITNTMPTLQAAA